MEQKSHSAIMREAIRLSIGNVAEGGGPFAAIIACGGKILARGVNTVIRDHDPTAHAEINAIRAATAVTGDFKLNGCVIYTTCEPCPMCLGAIYWAGLKGLYYANSREDAARFGFADDHLYREMERPHGAREIPFTRLLGEEAIEAFQRWDELPGKVKY